MQGHPVAAGRVAGFLRQRQQEIADPVERVYLVVHARCASMHRSHWNPPQQRQRVLHRPRLVRVPRRARSGHWTAPKRGDSLLAQRRPRFPQSEAERASLDQRFDQGQRARDAPPLRRSRMRRKVEDPDRRHPSGKPETDNVLPAKQKRTLRVDQRRCIRHR